MQNIDGAARVLRDSAGRHQDFMQAQAPVHGNARRHAHRTEHDGRRPAAAFQNTDANARLENVFRISVSDDLLNFFFVPAFRGNGIFDERQRRDVSVFVDFDRRVQIRLAKNSNIENVARAQPISPNALVINAEDGWKSGPPLCVCARGGDTEGRENREQD